MIDTGALIRDLVHTGFLSDLMHEAVDQVIAARRLHQPTVDELAERVLVVASGDPTFTDPRNVAVWAFKVAEAFVKERAERAAAAKAAKGGG